MNSTSVAPLLAAFEVHYKELVAFVRQKVNCPVLAADIVQETYLRLASGSTPAHIENPRAFLYRAVGNRAIDHIRREKTRSKYVLTGLLPDNVSDGQPTAERAVAAKQKITLLLRIVDELPPRCREVFLLRKIEGLDQAEIARKLGISPNMVAKHVRKALLHCTVRLRDYK